MSMSFSDRENGYIIAPLASAISAIALPMPEFPPKITITLFFKSE